MRPRFKLSLFSNSACKAAEPTGAGERLNNIFSRFMMNECGKMFHVRMVANIVIDGGKLYELAQESYVSASAQILMTNNAFGNSFGLILC